jgi:tripartite-type tricarboxylate transporter receptor subunit TctC
MHRIIRTTLAGAAFATALVIGFAGTSPAVAQQYPQKAVRVIVPFAAGGPTDVFARLVGNRLSETWGQPVVVENRPGATGTIGTALVAKAPADGYTLLMASTSSHISAYLYQNQSYDPNKDLDPIINVITLPFYLVGNPSFPANNVVDLIAEAKKNPGKHTFGSPGIGSGGHLVMEMFNTATGIKLVHVPYQGAAPAINAAVAGQVALVFDTVSTAHPQVRAGKLKAFAVSSANRSSAVPDVPTVRESGYPDFEASIWFGFFGPAGLPADITAKLNADIAKIMQTQEMRDRVTNLGGEFAPQTPAQFREVARRDSAKWQQVIKSTGAKAE